MSKEREWRIPVSYEIAGVTRVMASSRKEAIGLAYDCDIDLLEDREYIDGSFQVNEDCIDKFNRKPRIKKIR